mgnify:CR=1 FL=1
MISSILIKRKPLKRLFLKNNRKPLALIEYNTNFDEDEATIRPRGFNLPNGTDQLLVRKKEFAKFSKHRIISFLTLNLGNKLGEAIFKALLCDFKLMTKYETSKETVLFS